MGVFATTYGALAVLTLCTLVVLSLGSTVSVVAAGLPDFVDVVAPPNPLRKFG